MDFNADAVLFVTAVGLAQRVGVLYVPRTSGDCPGGRWVISQEASADFHVIAFVP